MQHKNLNNNLKTNFYLILIAFYRKKRLRSCKCIPQPTSYKLQYSTVCCEFFSFFLFYIRHEQKIKKCNIYFSSSNVSIGSERFRVELVKCSILTGSYSNLFGTVHNIYILYRTEHLNIHCFNPMSIVGAL